MPTLENPRYEAFAQARAKRALLIDAYESAGFVGRRGDCCLASNYTHERRHLPKVFNDLTPEQVAAEASKAAIERPAPPRQRPTLAPRAPRNLLASAAISPLALPGLSPAPSH